MSTFPPDSEPIVSVVVPAYNPGPHIEPCIRSILEQTMSRRDVEAVFVDDGSTDGTGALLDRLAEREPNVRVIHLPGSGAAGRPRNVGIAAARGTFVVLLDADDELERTSLERMTSMAIRNGSDVVVGRFVSTVHQFQQRLFERSIEKCTLATEPRLVGAPLHVGRLYRRSFLVENRIAFNEEWRKSEDQAFTLTAMLRARVISVLGGGTCYRYHVRSDAENISAEAIDPARDFGYLGAVLDLAIAETAPGPLRSHIVRRLYRTDMLSRLRGRTFIDADDAVRAEIVACVGAAAHDYVDAELERGLSPVTRARSRLARAGEVNALLDLARLESGVVGTARADSLAWDRGRLRIDAAAQLSWADTGSPVVVVRSGGRVTLDPRVTDAVGESIDVTREMGTADAELYLRAAATGLEWRLPARSTRRLEQVHDDSSGDTVFASRTHVAATFDPRAVTPMDGGIASGAWEVWLTQSTGGIGARTRVVASDAALPEPGLVGLPARVVVPLREADGLLLDVGCTTTSLAEALTGRPILLLADGSTVAFLLPMTSEPGAGSLPVGLVIRTPAGDCLVQAEIAPHQGLVRLSARDLPADAPAGTHAILARLDASGPDLPLGTARVDRAGRIAIGGLPRVSPLERWRRAAAWRSRGVQATIRRGVARSRAAIRRR